MKRVALLLCLAPFAFAQDIDLPHTLSNNSVANADQVMANFNALKDGVNSRISVDLTNYNVVLGNGLQLVTPGTPAGYNGKHNTASGYLAPSSTPRAHTTPPAAVSPSSTTPRALPTPPVASKPSPSTPRVTETPLVALPPSSPTPRVSTTPPVVP